MSGAIGRVLKEAAQKIEQAIGDAGKAVRKHFDDTGSGLRKSAEAHATHDAKAAQDLEKAAKHETADVKPKGGGETPSRSGGSSGSPSAGASAGREVTLEDGTTHTVAASREDLRRAENSSADVASALKDHNVSPDELQKLINTPVKDLTEEQSRTLHDIRHSIAAPENGTLMQKVIPPGSADNYLNGTYGDTVRGFVTKAGDARELDTPEKVFHGLRLDYKPGEGEPPNPFHPDEPVHAIRYDAGPLNAASVPDGLNAAHMQGKTFDGEVLPDPFTGNGFTKSADHVVPEYVASGQMPPGAEMWKTMPDGSEHLLGVLKEVNGAPVWVKVAT